MPINDNDVPKIVPKICLPEDFIGFHRENRAPKHIDENFGQKKTSKNGLLEDGNRLFGTSWTQLAFCPIYFVILGIEKTSRFSSLDLGSKLGTRFLGVPAGAFFF